MFNVQLDDNEVIAAAIEYRKENHLGLKEMAAMADMAESTLSQIFSGTYTGNLRDQMRKFRNWFIPLLRPESLDVVPTESFQSLQAYFDAAVERHAMFCITGLSGFGKTIAARFYARTHIRAYHIEGRVNMGGKNLMQEIIRQARIRTRITGSVYELQNTIIDHFNVRRALLIVDEADKLAIKTLDSLREIYDAGPVAIVLIGEPNLVRKLRSADRSGHSLERMYSRIDEFVEINVINRDDVETFIEENALPPIRSREAFDRLLNTINRRGGYRMLAKVVDELRVLVNAGDQRADRITQEQLAHALAKFPV